MTVQRYLFQSPSSSQVQIGRPDPSVQKEDTSTASSSAQASIPNETLTKAQSFQASQVNEVTPTVQSSSSLLDVYA